MQEDFGAPMETHTAWGMLDGWKASGREIGVVFWGSSGSLYTLGCVESAAGGRLSIRGQGARASFNLSRASFKYGPMRMWPRWPSPPIVEVNALRAEFENGDYLALAEGLTAPPVSSPSLPS
jgi:hypothetical protein